MCNRGTYANMEGGETKGRENVRGSDWNGEIIITVQSEGQVEAWVVSDGSGEAAKHSLT